MKKFSTTYIYKNLRALGCALITFLCFDGVLKAQTPSDGMMMGKREICIALTYDRGAFDEYWEGTYLRTNQTIATVVRKTIMPMVAVGVVENLNFYIGLPYVKTESTEPNGGLFKGAKGFQDLTLALKYRMLHQELGNGTVSLFAAGGFATPMTNYLSDYRPYSIGNGTDEWSLRGIAQYKFDMGFYVRAMGGHLFRGQTKAERDYYYNNGSYFTPWMDVPSAWEYNAVVGIWTLDNSLKLEASYYGLNSTSGDDVRSYNAAQPTNKVQFSQIGANAHYFLKPVKGLGILAYFSSVLDGRNTGKSTTIGVGANYQFKF